MSHPSISNPLAQGSIGLENVDSLSGHNDKNSHVTPLKRAHLRNKYKASLSSSNHGDFMDVSSSPIWGNGGDRSDDVDDEVEEDVSREEEDVEKEENKNEQKIVFQTGSVM